MSKVSGKTKFGLILWKNYRSIRCSWKIFVFDCITKFCLILAASSIIKQGKYFDPIFPPSPGEVNPLNDLTVVYTPTNNEVTNLMEEFSEHPIVKTHRMKILPMQTAEELNKYWQKRDANNSADTAVVGVIFEEMSKSGLTYYIRIPDKIDANRLFVRTRTVNRYSWRKYYAKFLTTQRIIDGAYIKYVTGQKVEIPFPEMFGRRTELSKSHKAVHLSRFIAWSGIFLCFFFFKNNVIIKENGIKYYMECIGLGLKLQWFGRIIEVMTRNIASQCVVAYALMFCLRLDWPLLWLYMTIYVFNTSCYIMFLTVFFKTVMTGLVVVFLTWIATSSLGRSYVLIPDYFEDPATVWLLCFFFPNFGMSVGLLSVVALEEEYITGKETHDDSVQIAKILIVNTTSALFFYFLGLVLDKMWHPEKGTKWNFFLKSQKSPKQPMVSAASDVAMKGRKFDSKSPFQPPPPYVYPEVRVRNVVRFARGASQKRILDDLSIDFYANEMTFVLGETGSGKSTLAEIIIGKLHPDKGTVFHGNLDVTNEEDLDVIRTEFGWCPQENKLISCMTVIEHFKLLGKLRGVPAKRLEKEIKYVMTSLAIENVANVDPTSKKIPESTKRRISVGCAVVGRPPIIILDNPSRGVDPEGTRKIWNVIQSLRHNRVVIVLTNRMYEAEEFADRIVILRNGKVHCWGTPRFLKDYYETGWELVVDKGPLTLAAVEAAVVRHASDARQRSFRPGLASFRLPPAARPRLPAIVRELRAMGVPRVAFSVGGIDEVVMKTNQFAVRRAPDRIKYYIKLHQERKEKRRYDDVKLWDKFVTLIRKEIILIKRYYPTYLLGAIFLLVPMTVSYKVGEIPLHGRHDADTHSSRKVSLGLYGGVVPYEVGTNTNDIEKAYKNLVNNYNAEPRAVSNIKQWLKEQENKNTHFYNYMIHVGARLSWETGSDGLVPGTPFYSPYGVETCSVSVSLLSNAVLAALGKKDVSITVYNNPFPKDVPTMLGDLVSEALLSELVPLALYLWLALFARSANAELTSGCHTSQLRAGASSLLIWSVRFLCHLTVHALVGFALIILIIVCNSFMYGCPSALEALYLIWFVNGIGGIPFVYMLAQMGFTDNRIVTVLTALVVSTTIFFQIYRSFYDTMRQYEQYYAIAYYTLPTVIANMGFKSLNTKMIGHSVCRLKRPNLCPIVFEPEGPLIIRRECMLSYEYTTEVRLQLVLLTCIGLLWFMGVVLVDTEPLQFFVQRMKDACRNFRSKAPTIDQEALATMDESLVSEKKAARRAYNATPTLTPEEALEAVLPPANVLVAAGVWLWDVRGRCLVGNAAGGPLSFRVRTGECMGLLVQDVAACRPLLHMLTGRRFPLHGDVAGVEARLRDDRRRFMWNTTLSTVKDGYLKVMTEEEHIQLICGLHGINHMHYLVRWGGILGLWPTLSLKTGVMAPGERSLLTLAVALIGDKSVALVEKPTKDMDPHSKRRVAAAFFQYQEDLRSIVIVSNAMREVDALCHRVAVVYSGRFICLGNPLYLADRARKGRLITFEVKHRRRDTKPLVEEMKRQYGDRCTTEYVGKYQRKVRFNVVGNDLLEDLIEQLEMVRAAVPGVVDYCVYDVSRIPLLSNRLVGILGIAERL